MTLKVPLVAAVCSMLMIGALAAPAFGKDGGGGGDDGRRDRDGGREFRLRDECDPVTFNANGRVLCTPGITEPEVTLQQLQAFLVPANAAHILAERDALGWKIQPDNTTVRRGSTVTVRSRGGETHTFSDVTDTGFTGGCVAGLNAPFGLSPNVHCTDGSNLLANTAVPAGGSRMVTFSTVGTRLFECLIHPWMRSTVVVRD